MARFSTRPGRAKFPALACAAGIFVAYWPLAAQAGTIADPIAPYDVTHTFNFTPAGGVVAGQWNYQVFTSAAFPGTRCGPKKGSVAMPVPAQTQTCTSTATSGASAVAHSSVKTTAFAPGNVAGQIHVDGVASVPAMGEAFSSARSAVVVRGGRLMRSGRIAWGPAMSSSVSGQGSVSVHDPISFDILDTTTGVHTIENLEDIEGLLIGPGSFSWASDTFSVNANDFTFTIDMTNPFILPAEQGSVDFQIRGGIVVASDETGIFAGLLPSVGSSGSFSTPFSTDLTIDYDFGGLGGSDPVVTADFGNGGEATVPEPGAVFLLGSGRCDIAAGFSQAWERRPPFPGQCLNRRVPMHGRTARWVRKAWMAGTRQHKAGRDDGAGRRGSRSAPVGFRI